MQEVKVQCVEVGHQTVRTHQTNKGLVASAVQFVHRTGTVHHGVVHHL